MFLRGRVATDDSTAVPKDVMVERVCNDRVIQQVYTSPLGDFSMQLGTKVNAVLDASGDPLSQSGTAGKDTSMGIPRRELANCELRATVSGFYDGIIRLAGLDNFGGNIDVGAIVVQRTAKIEGLTLSATPYQAPKEAVKAYEKGQEAERKGNFAGAHKYFETAVQSYPKYTSAWFRLGNVLQKENQKDAARKAYTQATTIDDRFLPPYLSLASMAYEDGNWTALLDLTNHILERDPMNHAAVTSYIVDLDPLNCADAYFYNAMANYQLNKFADAERSGVKAEHLALLTRFPQLHLLMAEIFVRKNDYANAISEMQTYLELAPHASNAEQVRAQLAKFQKLNDSASSGEKPDRM